MYKVRAPYWLGVVCCAGSRRCEIWSVSYALPHRTKESRSGSLGGNHTHAGSWELEPENENGLEGVVEGEVVEKDAEGKRLDEIEEAKDDPVRQPLDVVILARGLEGTEAEVGGKSPADEVGGGCGEGVDKDEEGAEDGAAEDQSGLRDLRAGLDVEEHGVARQLADWRGRARKRRGEHGRRAEKSGKNGYTSLSSWEL